MMRLGSNFIIIFLSLNYYSLKTICHPKTKGCLMLHWRFNYLRKNNLSWEVKDVVLCLEFYYPCLRYIVILLLCTCCFATESLYQSQSIINCIIDVVYYYVHVQASFWRRWIHSITLKINAPMYFYLQRSSSSFYHHHGRRRISSKAKMTFLRGCSLFFPCSFQSLMLAIKWSGLA